MHVASPALRCRASATHVEFCGLASERTSECTTSEASEFDNICYRPVLGLVYLMISHSWGIFCVVVAQDRAATKSQQLLDSLREGYAVRGAGWLRQELTKRTAVQLRQLAGAADVQQ